jgi:hypothetical protein
MDNPTLQQQQHVQMEQSFGEMNIAPLVVRKAVSRKAVVNTTPSPQSRPASVAMSTATPAPYHPQSAFTTPTPQPSQQQQQQPQYGYMQQQPIQNTQPQQAQQQVQPQQFQHPQQQHHNATPAPLQHHQSFPSMAERNSISSGHSGRSSFSGVSVMTPPSTVASPAWQPGNTPMAAVQPTQLGDAVGKPVPGGPACNHCKNGTANT